MKNTYDLSSALTAALREQYAKASPVEGLLLLELLEQANKLQDKIGALVAAKAAN